MQQKVPIVSSLCQHRFVSLNMRFRSNFRALPSRCIYLPLSPRVHRPRRHLWLLLISGPSFHDLIILPWSFSLSSLSNTLSMSSFTLHCYHHCYLAIISPSCSLFCHHFPIFTVIFHVFIILSLILILKPLMKNQGDGQQSRVTGPSSKVHLRL